MIHTPSPDELDNASLSELLEAVKKAVTKENYEREPVRFDDILGLISAQAHNYRYRKRWEYKL